MVLYLLKWNILILVRSYLLLRTEIVLDIVLELDSIIIRKVSSNRICVGVGAIVIVKSNDITYLFGTSIGFVTRQHWSIPRSTQRRFRY